ncbi:MAG TPA: hypothetical protein VFG86_08540 [Chloroflexota bacterium]|jgi:hypothetical protein|nr:hypothetical protein [Chloroflexota bacterium]
MARMNISIPDPLYERLDRLRDRVNASKVCAGALEKELDMIEGRSSLADPEIERLLNRLQGTRERWYGRGREDGKRWAVETATREQLWHAVDELEGESGEELASALRRHRHEIRRIFGSYDFTAALEKWSRTDQGDQGDQAARDESWSASQDEADEDEDDDEDERTARAIRPDVDLASYMEGWRDVLQEIWKAVAPRLRR